MKALKINGLKQLTPDNILDYIQAYFRQQDQHSKVKEDKRGREYRVVTPYTLSGLCIFLGISYTQMKELETNPDYCEQFAYAREKIEQQIVRYSLTGEFNAIFAKFYLANRFKYQDRVTHDLSEDSKKLIESQQQINNRISNVLRFEKKETIEEAEVVTK